GIIEIMNGDLEAAEKTLWKGLLQNLNNFDLLYNLAYLYQTKGSNHLALTLYKRAREYTKTPEYLSVASNAIEEIENKIIAQNKNIQFQKPLVSIVLLAYNHLDYTKQCVESVYHYTKGIDFELITVNNGSSDGTREYFDSLPNVKKVHLPENVGCVNGFNAGLIMAEGKYTAAICNDFIFTTNWLHNLLKCIESDDKIGYVSPGSDNISNYQLINYEYKGIEQLQDFAEKYNISDPKKWEERVRLLPNVLMVRTEIFKKVGYYDPIFYFGEFADDDIALRIRRAGYKLVFLRDTFVHHFGSITVGVDQRMHNSLQVSREIFFDKHGIDAWDDASFNYQLVEKVNYNKKSSIKILGINTCCGGTPLQVKNRFNESGVKDTVIYNFTDDIRFITDLQTVSDFSACGTSDELETFIGNEKFDIIIVERGFITRCDPGVLISSLKRMLKNDGQLLIIASNLSYYTHIIKLLNGIRLIHNDCPDSYLGNRERIIALLHENSFTNITSLGCKKYIPELDIKLIEDIVQLPYVRNKENSKELLSVFEFIIFATKE
ncbi:MAG: glycosyltransferase family 2 protein, partial [Negativicutes bacterium]|nr:glycosyltransferase family 2 protein [Negativicutes bacterium]